MVGEELRHRTIGDAATFGKEKLFGDPVLNPGRWDREHVGDILDFESAQTLCRVVEIPKPLPDSRNSAAEPLRNQCQRRIAVDGPEQVVLIRVRPARRSSPAQIQRCRAFLDRIPGPRGWCCRIARRAARKPPRAQAVFRTSSNSAVQRQVLPLGLPTFRPFLRPAFILFPARWCCLVVLDAPRTAAEFRHSPDWLSTEISSSRPGKSDLDLARTMKLITLTTAV